MDNDNIKFCRIVACRTLRGTFYDQSHSEVNLMKRPWRVDVVINNIIVSVRHCLSHRRRSCAACCSCWPCCNHMYVRRTYVFWIYHTVNSYASFVCVEYFIHVLVKTGTRLLFSLPSNVQPMTADIWLNKRTILRITNLSKNKSTLRCIFWCEHGSPKTKRLLSLIVVFDARRARTRTQTVLCPPTSSK